MIVSKSVRVQKIVVSYTLIHLSLFDNSTLRSIQKHNVNVETLQMFFVCHNAFLQVSPTKKIKGEEKEKEEEETEEQKSS